MPATMLNSSLVRCVAEPRPAVAYCTTPGFSLASLTSSATVFTPSEGLTTRMLAVSACGATAMMPLQPKNSTARTPPICGRPQLVLR